jgi:hypothetical protein
MVGLKMAYVTIKDAGAFIVWGTPWETKRVALPFGKAIHKAAEYYYRSLKDTGEIIFRRPAHRTFGVQLTLSESVRSR